jgi:two-component system, sensor histidine kinase
MSSIRDISRILPPLDVHTKGGEALACFKSDPTIRVIAVTQNGEPFGILVRDTFMMRLADQFGQALYEKRSVSTLVNTNYHVVDAGTRISELTRRIAESEDDTIYSGFIVVSNGQNYGVCDGLDLLKAAASENAARAQALSEINTQVTAAHARAEEASAAKARFLSMMSHEIRTPLNGVLGVAQILAATPLNAEQSELVQTIQNSGNLLHHLLSDVLDVNKAEAGKLTLRKDDFRLSEIVSDLELLWRGRATEKDIALHVSLAANAPESVRGDSVRLRQILFNLVGNAIKFTDSGSVDVIIEAHADQGRIRLIARVRDTGCGMSKEQQARLFRAFEQVHGPTESGSGLGLHISQTLAKLMEGDVVCQSWPGRGSIFTLTCLFDQAENTPSFAQTPTSAVSAKLSSGALAGHRILIVEDNATNRLVVSRLLKAVDCDWEMAENGQQALKLLADQRYDLILMDLRMPVLDGLEATRALRMSPGPNQHTPIIALTASASTETRNECEENQMEGFVEKPIRAADLFAEMERCLGFKEARQFGRRVKQA